MTASQLRTGMAIRFDSQTWKVLAADYQPGQGKMGGVMHARLKNLGTGTTWEHGFRAELRLEEVPVEKRPADFLYKDGHDYVFMDPETFEQFPISSALLGQQGRLLVPEMRVNIESVDGTAVAVTFADVLELRVKQTDPPIHGAVDSTWKAAELENGLGIMVPQFVKTGDVVRLSTAELRYMDRAKTTTK